MPADEASQPIAAGVGLRQHRAAIQQPPQIVGQLSRRPVAPFRLGLQCLEHHTVDVTRQSPDQPRGRGLPRGGECRRRSRPGLVCCHLPADDDARWNHDWRVTRSARGRILPTRSLPGQQLVQHRAEHVDVGGRADRLAAELFRGGVGGRQRAQPGPGRIGERMIRLQQLGDAEVEQLHLAGARHQDVRGLQVPVDDERLVRVLRGLADAAEETQAIVDGQPVRVGVRRDRRAVDVLHHQVRRALRCVAGIDQAGDVGMREAGEDVALGREAEGAVRARRASHQLQRDALLVLAVVALGQVDGAHAAVAEDVHHPPRAEADTDERIRVGPRLASASWTSRSILERVLRPVGGEHRVDLGTQTAVCAAHAVEIASALTLRQLERTLERCVEARPPVRIPGQSHDVAMADRANRTERWSR